MYLFLLHFFIGGLYIPSFKRGCGFIGIKIIKGCSIYEKDFIVSFPIGGGTIDGSM